jgi:hypothetical protein
VIEASNGEKRKRKRRTRFELATPSYDDHRIAVETAPLQAEPRDGASEDEQRRVEPSGY